VVGAEEACCPAQDVFHGFQSALAEGLNRPGNCAASLLAASSGNEPLEVIDSVLERGGAVLFSSHDERFIARTADRVHRMPR